MADIVSREVRSRMMSGIRGKNTKPELLIRKGLHRLGFRYRLHDTSLPGKPDIVLRRHRAIIFVHGCFWHGHNCHLFKWPKTRPDFWVGKIERNKEVDREVLKSLREQGWRHASIWECALKGKTRKPLDEILLQCKTWLLSESYELEIRGQDESGTAF
jgi:DNA mismatch endonuclease (patch repair protein)